jgi:hypothetical protein
MATTPLINLPDGSGTTTSLNLSTNSTNFIFSGLVDANTIDVQIDVNESGFISDPALVNLTVPTFTIPNLSAFPNGLALEKGLNTIRVRAVDLSGSVSPAAIITVDVVSEVELFEIESPPTGIQLQRKSDSVFIEWSDVGLESVTNFNIYASTGQGGSGSGYLRLNQNPIPITSFTEISEEITEIGSASLDFDNPDFITTGPTLDNPEGSNDIKITSTLVDSVQNTVIQETSVNRYSLLNVPKVRFNFSVENVVQVKNFRFEHNRNDSIGNGILNSDVFSLVSPDNPLFYVITSLVFDTVTGQLRESRFSSELSGAPLPLDTTVRGLRIREQPQIVQDYIAEVQSAQPTLALIPGSTVREVHIEPFANESQKMYFLMDFVSRSKSFEAMLQIDDPNKTGTSVLVRDSSYKQQLRAALSLSSDAAVQRLIDNSFESLASNFNVQRAGRRPATVTQTFFTTTAPAQDLIVNQNAVISSSGNSTAPRFRTAASITLPAAAAQAYFNPDTRRFEVRIQAVAETPGSIGNVAAGDLDTVVSGADGFQTINTVASDFGRDLASNLEIAEDASRVLSSLDSGTPGGYEVTSIGTPGLIESKVIMSGDPFMMRDYDDVRKKHIGGKVDVYVRGTLERTVQETFAFQFSIARSVRFDVIDPVSQTFRARDSRLSEDNPINEMLFNPSQNLGLRNQSNTPTTSYDLTGVVIVDFQTIRLNTAIPQPSTFLDDFVEGDYRFRSNNRFTATLQPIIRVTSVVGEISGALDIAGGFTLFQTQDPLLEGRSTIASDYVEINQVDDVPSGDSITVNAEEHTMIGQFEEPLNSVGINEFTLQVFSQDRTTQYKGPTDANPDYLVVSGSQTSPLKLIRTTSSSIANGSVISVDYEHDENFVVTYVINDVLQQLQSRYSRQRHATADVLVKQALENGLALEATCQLLPNADQPTTDNAARSNITILTDKRGISNPIRQSDATSVIDQTDGIDFIVQPLTRFSLVDGSIRVRDSIPSENVLLASLSQFSNSVYILTQEFPFKTSDGGGPTTLHKGVFKDEQPMALVTVLTSVGKLPDQAYIIGRLGAVINGYSDDATLTAAGFTTPAARDAERLARTANRAVVSLNSGIVPPDLPDDHEFAVSYIVSGDTDTKDLEVSSIEAIVPSAITFTYRAAK